MGADALVDEAVENLRAFHLVGFLDEMPAWEKKLSDLLGTEVEVAMSNRSPEPSMADSIREDGEIVSQIENLCSHDIQIYNRMKTGAENES